MHFCLAFHYQQWQLQHMQNAAVRMIWPPGGCHVTPGFEGLHWLPVCLWVEVSTTSMVYQHTTDNTVLEYLSELLTAYCLNSGLISPKQSTFKYYLVVLDLSLFRYFPCRVSLTQYPRKCPWQIFTDSSSTPVILTFENSSKGHATNYPCAKFGGSG